MCDFVCLFVCSFRRQVPFGWTLANGLVLKKVLHEIKDLYIMKKDLFNVQSAAQFV